MITGTGDFKQMVSVGLLLGVIIISIQSLLQGAKQIDFHQILVGWILYACFFGPTTTVTIEDAYTGQVRVVANVPLGVGFAGGMISNVGYTITRLFEQGYGVISPHITENRFAESLKLLNDVRWRTYNSRVFKALNEANGGGYVNVRDSWENYMRECTIVKLNIREKTLDELWNAPIDQAMRFDSRIYGTLLYLDPTNPQGTNYDCTDAWGEISKTLDFNNPVVLDVLNKTLGINPALGYNAITKTGDALQAVGASNTFAIDYAKTALLKPVYYQAAIGKYQHFHDYSSALMLNQAIQQRNTQQAAEQSMFMSVVRPMMTFFEGFVYAITPIMAFMIVMGSFGIKLAGKYMQTILWIQLWMPVLSIINLFIHMAASNEMASLSASAAGLSSFYALDSAADTMQNWIATGGMLAAATPLISLFIVTGSTYAFTGLASRISGADHVDEKIASPDVDKPGPLLESAATYSQNPFSGTIKTGTESMIPKLTLGTQLGSGVASAQTLQNQKAQAFRSDLGRGLSDGVSQDQTYSRLSDVGRSMSSQHSAQSQMIEKQAKSFSDQFQMDDKHLDAVRGVVALKGSGAIDANLAKSILKPLAGTLEKAGLGTKAKVGLDGSSESSAQDVSTFAASDVSDFVKGIDFTQSDQQALTNQLAQGFSRKGGEAFKETWGDTLSQNLSKSASELMSATKTFTTMSDLKNQFGSMTNTDFKTLGGAIVQNKAALNSLNDYFRLAPQDVRQKAVGLESRYQGYGMSPQVAEAAARLGAITQTSQYPEGQKTRGLKAALDVLNLATGRNVALGGDAFENSGIRGPETEGIKDKVNEAVGEGPHLAENFRSHTASLAGTNPASEANQLSSSSQLIEAHHEAGTAALQHKAAERERAVSAPEIKKSEDNLLHAQPEMSRSASGWGAFDNSTDWLARKAERGVGALVAGGQAGEKAFEGALDQLRTLTPEQRDQFVAATQRGDEALKAEHGWVGEIAIGAERLGRGILGAAATGMNAAQEWLTGQSDLSEAAKGMSLEERGAFYAAALGTAAEAGNGAAQQFMDQHGAEFKETMQTLAQSRYGLTEPQAAVYAESYDIDTDRMAQAVNNLKMEYAERDSDGNVMMDKEGNPVLSERNAQVTDKLVDILQNSTDAGDRSGSYLTAVRGYNIVNKGFEF
jgi:conjugal transfer mating pair stabilization protein TraG